MRTSRSTWSSTNCSREAAGNAALRANYRRVVNELILFRRETLARDADHMPVSTKDHEAIVEAVARGDGDAPRGCCSNM